MLDGPAGAYVHIPFCSRICPFCPYNKVVPRGEQPSRYFTALTREIGELLDAGVAGTDGFTSVYVGGGTPTLFPEDLAVLLALLPCSGERAVECLPTHATPPRLADLRRAGVTAVSIGAQSFHDEVLRVLRRPHDGATARAAVRAAVGRFPLVDVDLIVDVTIDDRLGGAFLADLAECLAMGVDQVSTYPLMRFGYTPFGQAHHERRREHEVLAEATRLADGLGYERRSVWTFNRVGTPTYTSITRRRFVGFGAGASSYLGRDFLVEHFGVQTYIDALAAGRLPVAHWLHLGALGGLGYDAFWQAYGGLISPSSLVGYQPWQRALPAVLVPLQLAGLLSREGTADQAQYRLTPRGFDRYHDLERWVTYQLIEPLWAQMLAEHAAEGNALAWADPGRARRGTAWRLAARLLERDEVTGTRGTSAARR